MTSRASFQAKKTRFRFTNDEQLKTINEVTNILRNGIVGTEEDLWETLRVLLINANPGRFSQCSIRLLREHILDQVKKYKDCESAENVERLRSAWGQAMSMLVRVWPNYENISGRVKGRSRRDTSLENDEMFIKIEPDEEISVEETSGVRNHRKDDLVLSYLSKKICTEKQLKERELDLRERELEYKKQMLDFEREKWRFEMEERRSEKKKNDVIIGLLETIVKSGKLNKDN